MNNKGIRSYSDKGEITLTTSHGSWGRHCIHFLMETKARHSALSSPREAISMKRKGCESKKALGRKWPEWAPDVLYRKS